MSLNSTDSALSSSATLATVGSLSLGFADNLPAEAVKRPYGQAARLFVVESAFDPLLQIFLCIFRIGQHQQFLRLAILLPNVSQSALATITEVLPLPAAATTRLRSSSITTALSCSSVKGCAFTPVEEVSAMASTRRRQTILLVLLSESRPALLRNVLDRAQHLEFREQPDRLSGHRGSRISSDTLSPRPS